MKGHETTAPVDFLPQLKEVVSAERYLIVWRAPGTGLQVIAAHGFSADLERIFISEALSVSVLEEVARTGTPRWSDDQELQDASLTFMLAGIRSYICVPCKLPNGVAIFYLDDRHQSKRFSFTDYTNVLNLARRLSAPPPSKTPAPRRIQTQVAPIEPKKPTKQGALAVGQQVTFFRCLATFIQSGIPLLHGLHALAEQGETPRLRQVANTLHQDLLNGNSLTEGCSRLAVFPPLVVQLIYCAERSGQLAQILGTVATYLEDSHNRRRRIQGALIYPAVVFAVCILMAIALPTFILRDQLLSYAHLGGLPWPTQVLLSVGNTLRNPWAVTAIVIIIAGLIALIQRATRTAHWHRFLMINPLTSRVYSARQELVLASTLGLQLRAGIPLLESMKNALSACASPLIGPAQAKVLDTLREGEPIARAMEHVPGISKHFLRLLSAGEESGYVGSSLEWIARNAELDFETSIESAVSLVEPCVMVFMGILVGFVTLASLLPTLKLLESI